MATTNSETVDSKLALFDIVQSNYKIVHDHGIRADFLIPKTPFEGKRPVIISFHGGGFVTGDSLFLDWFPHWVFDLALKHGAIIASPNYRLLPEATGLDIIDDIDDFWSWLHSPIVADLLSSQPTPTKLNLTHIITAGYSAGGTLSICLALMYPDSIRAATASYPALDIKALSQKRDKPAFDNAVFTPESIIDDAVDNIRPESVVSSDLALTRLALSTSIIEHGRLNEFYGRGEENSHRHSMSYPEKQLDSPGVKIPHGGIVIVHRDRDSAIPLAHSEAFVNKARKVLKGKQGGDKVFLSVQEGDHAFDILTRLEEDWLSDVLKVAVEIWLE